MNNIIKLTFLFAFTSLYNPLLSQIQEKNTLFIEALDVKSIFSNNSPRIGASLGTKSALYTGANIQKETINSIDHTTHNFSIEYRRFFKIGYLGSKVSYSRTYTYGIDPFTNQFGWMSEGDALFGYVSFGHLIKIHPILYVDANINIAYNTYLTDGANWGYNSTTGEYGDVAIYMSLKFGLFGNKKSRDYITSKNKM